MKKSLVALAVLAAAGAASAQSSVTLFGIVDATLSYGRAAGPGGTHRAQLTNSGYNSSRLGFRGVEDLGGGLSASFWLEAGLQNDNGAGFLTNTNNQFNGATGGGGLTFNRRSTVSLAGGFGEIRLGRDLTPHFWNLTVFDPFGTVGVGATQTLLGLGTVRGINALNGGPTQVRASNSIGYFLPARIGGFYGQAQVFLGENPRGGTAAQQRVEDNGQGFGLRLGYAAGPLNVAAAIGRTNFAATAAVPATATTAAVPAGIGDITTANLGASFDLGVARLMAHYNRDRVRPVTGAVTGQGFLVGALVPLGAGEIRAAYSQYSALGAGPDPRTRKVALGYVHNLSKRTAVYSTVAYARNTNGAATALGGATFGTGVVNQNSTGVDLGIRHSF